MNLPRARQSLLALFVALSVSMLGAANASAAMITYGLDIEFSGASPPEGSPPWLTATFDDVGGGTVRLTMFTPGLVEEEYVGEWDFNLDPSLDPTLLSFTPVGTPGSVPNAINTGVDSYKADGDGFFDIQFDFPPPGANRFTAGESVVYDITYGGAGTFNALSFNASSAPGGSNGTFFSAAHVQSIDSPAGENAGSGWIGDGDGPGIIPEPSSLVLCSIFLGVSAMGLRGRRSRAA